MVVKRNENEENRLRFVSFEAAREGINHFRNRGVLYFHDFAVTFVLPTFLEKTKIY